MSFYKNLEPLAFKMALENTKEAIIIDVRTPKEVAKGGMENALVIDYRMSDFTHKISVLSKEKTYFVYCQSGNRSAKTCMLMKNSNFPNVVNLRGGWNAWMATFLTNSQGEVKPMIRIGDKSPDFEAVTTTGRLRFSDYRADHWVILFSHPADFTPVCTTELAAFAEEQDYFLARRTKLLGLSIDSIHAHLAWINNIREKLGITISYPIIADTDMKVAQIYGMLHPGESSTSTVRALYFIDPSNVVRLILYYPVHIGRSISEIKRVLAALQTADNKNCAIPANWKQGEPTVLKAPKTLAEMTTRIADKDHEQIDFYLVKSKK